MFLRFNPSYEVYYSARPAREGEKMTISSRYTAVITKQYAYDVATWSMDPNQLSGDKVGIRNNNSQQVRTFGVSQKYEDEYGDVCMDPIISTTILQTSTESFSVTPLEIIIFWTRVPGKGISMPKQDENQTTYRTTLQDNVFQCVTYDGVWYPTPTSRSIPFVHIDPRQWVRFFAFHFSFPVESTEFVPWLQTQIEGVNADTHYFSGDSLVLEVYSAVDKTDQVLALQGKLYQSPLVHSQLAPGVEEIRGYKVEIRAVHPHRGPHFWSPLQSLKQTSL